jgi:ferredoxin
MGWRTLKFKAIVKLWPLGGISKKLGRMPLLDRTLGPLWWNERNLDATYIPIGETVEVGEGSVLPYQMIEEFIGRASNLFIIDQCVCRTAFRCRNHPQDIGCIFMGDAAGDITTEIGRPASPAEALEHVMRAREHGLLPCVIHSSFDATLVGIDYRKMLTTCFCCDCCCVFRTDMKGGPVAYRDRIIRLPGLGVETLGNCSGCGECARTCFLGAIEVGPEGPAIAEFCKGCGRCADICPNGNIRLRMDPGVETRRILLERIGARTDIGRDEAPI